MFKTDQKTIQENCKTNVDIFARAIIFAIVSANARFRDNINTMIYLDDVLGKNHKCLHLKV